MSSSSTSPPTTPAQPSTPPSSHPKAMGMGVRISLPTPPSFSTRRGRSASVVPSWPNVHPPEIRGGHQRSDSESVSSVTHGHPEELPQGIHSNLKVYRIPQRQRNRVNVNVSGEVGSGGPDQSIPSSFHFTESLGEPPTSLPAQSPPMVSPHTGAPSRYASTAAAKGLTITPVASTTTSSAHKRHSTGGPPGSIWSAGLGPGVMTNTAAGAGWISPALNSAKSTGGGNSRQRGLTVAVMKDGKGELLVGDVPVTPGLSTGGGLKSGTVAATEAVGASLASMTNGTIPTTEDAKAGPAGSVQEERTKQDKRKEIILCRYYHTPGLTCTSRPCRFVHNLDALNLSSPRDLATYPLQSPDLISATDPTGGTFAQAQMKAQAKILNIDELVSNGAVPGEKVVLAGGDGHDIVGTVFLMSGGGKGPAGKSKAKFKTVPCKDYAEGYCPYGDYCSFIHDEKAPTPTHSRSTDVPGSVQAQSPPDASNADIPSRRFSTGSKNTTTTTPTLDAWTKAITRAILVPSVTLDHEAVEKQRRRLSAFAAPYLERPTRVDDHGQLISPLTPRSENTPSPPTLALPPRPKGSEADLPQSIMSKQPSSWVKNTQPHPGLKKVSILEPESVRAAAASLAPPPSAISLFGTESDPATPFDPAIRRKLFGDLPDAQMQHLQQLQFGGSNTTLYNGPPSGLSSPVEYGPPQPQAQWNTPSYPWGMPMSPIIHPGQGAGDYPSIPGGPGVMWTPAGWAVQDAAMKHSLRAAEMKTKYERSRAKSGKTYYKTRPCKFFAEGNCPHGDNCTYLHSLPSSSSSETASDDKEKTSSPNPNPKHKTLPCKFYNSASGCNNGEDCAFLHTLVVPSSVPLVEKPRPWRTRPCRHYQLGRCTLGDACHFAHVLDPTRKSLSLDTYEKPCRHWQKGRCAKGEACRFAHEGQGGRGGEEDDEVEQQLTEVRLARAFEELRGASMRQEESDGEDDDVEIVTTASMSPARSVNVTAAHAPGGLGHGSGWSSNPLGASAGSTGSG